MKKQKMMTISMLVVLGLVCTGVLADVIYTNDFGTVAQLQEFTKHSGTRDIVFGPVGTVAYPDSGYNYIPGADLDGDTLANTAAVANDGTDTGWYAGRLTIEAPTGYHYDNLVLSGVGGGRASHTNYAQIGISNDGGLNFLFDSTRLDRAGVWVGLLEVDTTDQAGWDNVTSLVLEIRLATFYNEPPYYRYQGVLQNLTVTGDLVPEPATMAVVAAGGLSMLLKCRRK